MAINFVFIQNCTAQTFLSVESMVLKASPRRRQGVKALREAKASPKPSKKRGRARGRSDREMKGGARGYQN